MIGLCTNRKAIAAPITTASAERDQCDAQRDPQRAHQRRGVGDTKVVAIWLGAGNR